MFAQNTGQIKNKLDICTSQLKQALVYGRLIAIYKSAVENAFLDLHTLLVFLKPRLVLLAMPKCGSTALEAAFAPYADAIISGNPAAKHTPFRKYDRFLRRYFESFTDSPLEVVCLFREPVDWLGSWWRYRGRPDLNGKENSTQGMSFDDFVTSYLDGAAGPAKVGRQSQFVGDKEGAVGVDRIWRYENLDRCAAWLAERLAVEVDLQRLNVSPAQNVSMSEAVRARTETEKARDFEIYREVAV